MKNLFKIMVVTALAVVIGSCAKEDSEDPMVLMRKGVQRNISASAMLASATKTDKAALNASNGKISWELGDQINVNGTNMGETMLHNDFTKPLAEFNGTANALTSGDNEIYWAVYPTTLAGAYSGSIPAAFSTSSLTFTLPSSQTYSSVANTLSGYTYMAAYANVPQGQTDIVFGMHNLGAVLHLHLTAASGVNANVEKIEFSTTNGALAGNFTLATDTTTITPAASATKTLTLNLTNGANNYINISNGANIYVVLPPMSSKDLTMRIYNTDGNYTEKTAATATFARSYIYHNTVTGIDFSQSDDKYYFSVASGTKVVFSPGNLQWSATNGGSSATTHRTREGYAAGTWRFAEHQWNKVGFGTSDNTGNVYNNNNVKSNNASISQTYNGWIDLFGFGTSGYSNKYPYMTTTNNSSYGNGSNNIDGTYYDFGVYNDIYNPKTQRTDAYGTWRLLTISEWTYVFGSRTNAAYKRASATVNNVSGIVLLPDNWVLPNGLTFSTSSNNYNQAQWALMEENGAVFLPRCGNRNGTGYSSNMKYATSTTSGINYVMFGYMNNNQFSTQDNRYLGVSVRLVKPYTNH